MEQAISIILASWNIYQRKSSSDSPKWWVGTVRIKAGTSGVTHKFLYCHLGLILSHEIAGRMCHLQLPQTVRSFPCSLPYMHVLLVHSHPLLSCKVK
jgi:hypothetical protein